MKLDLGAGAVSPEGFTPLGNVNGTSIYPLAYPDASVDAIRASHVLEHFPHREIGGVVAEWARVLRPGGVLQIAVPDFAKISTAYLAGANMETEKFLMGGQIDAADFHKALFDAERLKQIMARAGLMLIREWRSDIPDCAGLPISLNLEGTKPHQAEPKTAAVMSMPRLAWTANAMCWVEALFPLKIAPRTFTGAYWEQCLERGIEQTIEIDDPDLILTLDYDTVFTKRDVAMLIQLMACHPEADAIAPVQAMRGSSLPLLTMSAPEGESGDVPRETFAADLTPIRTAHFGLTMLRVSKLKTLPKPWFRSEPAPDGTWNEGRRDADIAFWQKWAEHGNSLCLANRVAVGHLDAVILWPGEDLLTRTQNFNDWRRDGAPKDAWK